MFVARSYKCILPQMRISCVTAFFMLLLPTVCAGQEAVPPSCPTITVTGPAGVTQPGEVIEYTAAISGRAPQGVTPEWVISKGDIISGQGTLNIQIRTTKDGGNFTATLTVIGLPAGCPNSASETAPVDCICDPILLDEFGKLPPQEEKTRLDAAVDQLKKRPDFKLVLIEYFDSRSSERFVAAKIKRRLDYLTRTKGIAAQNVEVLSGGILETRTKIYIVSPRAENPAP